MDERISEEVVIQICELGNSNAGFYTLILFEVGFSGVLYSFYIYVADLSQPRFFFGK